MSESKSGVWKEVDFINRFLTGAHQRCLEDLRELRGGWEKESRQSILKLFMPFSDTHWLGKRLPSEKRPTGRLMQGSNLLFFDFIDKENALPIVDMRWDLTASSAQPELRFRFFLLNWEGSQDRPRVVGFRIESPEGPGAHNYSHAQMITEFEKDEDHIRRLTGGGNLEHWMPQKQPAVPIPARQGAEGMGDLLAVLLVSLYGLNNLTRFDEVDGYSELLERLKAMRIKV